MLGDSLNTKHQWLCAADFFSMTINLISRNRQETIVVLRRGQLLIGGQWATPSSGETISAYDSATEEFVGVAPAPTAAEIDRAVTEARQAFDEGPSPRMTPDERAAYLIRIAETLGLAH